MFSGFVLPSVWKLKLEEAVESYVFPNFWLEVYMWYKQGLHTTDLQEDKLWPPSQSHSPSEALRDFQHRRDLCTARTVYQTLPKRTSTPPFMETCDKHTHNYKILYTFFFTYNLLCGQIWWLFSPFDNISSHLQVAVPVTFWIIIANLVKIHSDVYSLCSNVLVNSLILVFLLFVIFSWNLVMTMIANTLVSLHWH